MTKFSAIIISALLVASPVSARVGIPKKDDDAPKQELSRRMLLANCEDNPIGWYDIDGETFNCEWYALGTRCEDHGDLYENMGTTANKACCACGGGTVQSTCEDSPNGWYDADGESFDCDWYGIGNRCADYGDSYANMGKTANEACCTCGGGSQGNESDEITYDKVRDALHRKGYRFFTGSYNVNLVAIRGPNRKAGSWDDILCMLYQDDNGTNQIQVFKDFTTDPGAEYLLQPLNSVKHKGTAIVAPGQYRGVYLIGTHSDYQALVQSGSEIKVYRDNNRDDMLNMDSSTIESGWFGINLHHGYNSGTVGNNSAGCQVLKSPSDLTTVLDICKKQQPHGYGSSFTYTLIDASDL